LLGFLEGRHGDIGHGFTVGAWTTGEHDSGVTIISCKNEKKKGKRKKRKEKKLLKMKKITFQKSIFYLLDRLAKQYHIHSGILVWLLRLNRSNPLSHCIDRNNHTNDDTSYLGVLLCKRFDIPIYKNHRYSKGKQPPPRDVSWFPAFLWDRLTDPKRRNSIDIIPLVRELNKQIIEG
jgi:hypothetical protein